MREQQYKDKGWVVESMVGARQGASAFDHACLTTASVRGSDFGHTIDNWSNP